MKVSILVPIYNVEKYIAECANSLFSQSYSDIEYVFVNDFTPDNSIEVLNSILVNFPNRINSVKIISHDKNKGLAVARNTGVEHAQGDYIFHVDSDDYIEIDAIEKMVNKAEETGADIIDAAFESVDNNGNCLHLYDVFKGNKETYIKLLISKMASPPPNIFPRLIRKCLYEKYSISAIPGINYAEDAMVVPQLLAVGSRDYIEDCVYFYRVDNPNSYTKTFSEVNIKSWIQATNHIYMFFSKPELYPQYGYYAEIGILNLMQINHYLSFPEEVAKQIPNITPKSILLKMYKFGLKNRLFYPMSAIIYRLLIKKLNRLKND